MKRTGPRDTIAADLNARLTTGPLSAFSQKQIPRRSWQQNIAGTGGYVYGFSRPRHVFSLGREEFGG